jgi:flagellar secretion chaperone FliS
MTYGANQYKQTSILTASRTELLVMLYEAAIRNVKKATVCMEKGDIPGKGTYVGKTHDILNELVNSLDKKVGGKIAEDLEGLYNFMIAQLIKANIENKTEPLKSIEGLLMTLLEGWREAINNLNKGTAPPKRGGGERIG